MFTKLLKLVFPPFFTIFNLLKQLFCEHDYEYWDTHIESVNDDGSLTFIQKISKTHRKCKKCQKSQMFDLVVGKTGWKMISKNFPKSGEAFTHYLNPKGLKTIREKRNEAIDKLLETR